MIVIDWPRRLCTSPRPTASPRMENGLARVLLSYFFSPLHILGRGVRMRKIIAVGLLLSTLGFGLPTVYRTVHRRFFGVRSEVYLEQQIMEYYYEDEVR